MAKYKQGLHTEDSKNFFREIHFGALRVNATVNEREYVSRMAASNDRAEASNKFKNIQISMSNLSKVPTKSMEIRRRAVHRNI